jgi:membrane protease YdiL (CAAX protease family)
LVTLLPGFILGTIVFGVVYGEITMRTGSFWSAVLVQWMGHTSANTLLTGFAGGGFVAFVPGKEWLASFGVEGVLMIAFFGLLGGVLYLKRRGQSEAQPPRTAGQTAQAN